MAWVIAVGCVCACRGAGETRCPLLSPVVGVFGVRLPVAYVCGIVLQGGLLGAWIGMCADMAVRALLVFVRYVRGKWVRTTV